MTLYFEKIEPFGSASFTESTALSSACSNVSNFAKNTKEGIELAQETYPEIFAQITAWKRYFYRWENGTNKLVDDTMTKDEAKRDGWSEGMDLTLKVLKPEFQDLFTLSMPQSSVWNFAKYVQFLLSKNVTPKHVATKMRSNLKQFRQGSPVPVLSFDAVGTIQPEQDAVNVTPDEEVEPAPQPVEAPVGSSQQTEIPQEWA